MSEIPPPSDDKDSRNSFFSIPITAAPGIEKLLSKYEEGTPPFSAVDESLRRAGYIPVSGREILSGGFGGPLFLIHTSRGPVVEKCFIYGGGRSVEEVTLGKRMRRTKIDKANTNTHMRLRIVNSQGVADEGIIDWVYNEERALKDLADIPGIPHYITSVYKELKGSVVEQYIEGYELFALHEHLQNPGQIAQIFKKIRETYIEAAKHGYVYNNLIGSSIIIENPTLQPYLTDWYNYSIGNIEKNVELRKIFEQNLKALDEYEQSLIRLISEQSPKV